MIGGAARVSERGVLVRKEIAVESGRARATDRGSGGLRLAEGTELKLFFHGFS